MISHELSASYGIAIREVRKFFRSRSRVFSSLFMPLLWLVVFGSGIGSTTRFVNAGLGSYVAFVFPGVIALNLFFRSIFAGVNVMVDKEQGFMREMLVAPISRFSIVLGKIAGDSVASLIQGCIILVLARLFDISFPLSSLLLIIPVMLLISAGFLGFGMFLASYFESVQGFQLVLNMFTMPVFMLSGAMFPLEGLPSWLAFLTRIDPLTYGVDALRHLILGFSTFGPVVDAFVIIGFPVVSISLAAWAFNRKE